jgi:hypothetical protein
MSLRWTSYLHVSHDPVLTLVARKRPAIIDNVAEASCRGCSKHSVTSLPKREESCDSVSRCEKIVNWDISFRGSGAQLFANS